jgi:hypothetical protein
LTLDNTRAYVHDPSGPENMTLDKNGAIFGANVRRRMIETYTKVK